MKVNLKTRNETVNNEGVCPSCKEWTTAGDSCCGDGAYVEGGLVTDEQAREDLEDYSVSVVLLKDVPEAVAQPVKKALWDAGLRPMMYGHVNEDKWTIRILVELDQLPVTIIKE